MSEEPRPAAPSGGGGRGMSRKNFLQGTVGAGVGGLVVGGAVGYAVGNSSSSSSSSSSDSGSGSGSSGGTIKIGSASPITGPYAGDGKEMIRGQEMAVAEI